jgi:hypothetical protein
MARNCYVKARPVTRRSLDAAIAGVVASTTMVAAGVRAWLLRGSAAALAASVVTLITLVAPAVAQAQPKVTAQQCNSAYESAQVSRKARKLRAARQDLLLCSQSQCPGPIAADCGPWLREVESALPSVVVVARDASGADVTALKVSVDGAVLASHLTGEPIDVDPGEHTFVFEPEHGAKVEQKLLVNVGEKHRIVQVAVRSEPPAPLPPGPVPIKDTPHPADEERHGSFVPGIVVGVVGVASLAASLGLYFNAKSAADGLRATCAPNCNPSDVDALRTKGIASDVTFGVGVAGIGTGVLLMILLRPQPAKVTTGFRAWPTLTPVQSGAAAGIAGTF